MPLNLHQDEQVQHEQEYADDHDDLVQPMPAFVGQFQTDTAAYNSYNRTK
jgi:hypothetical protein